MMSNFGPNALTGREDEPATTELSEKSYEVSR
jgi:hypothetical protein